MRVVFQTVLEFREHGPKEVTTRSRVDKCLCVRRITCLAGICHVQGDTDEEE